TKAFLCVAMAQLVHEEGMDLDVATGGEMHVALTAGVPAEKLVLHGNNKSLAELAYARTVGVGRVVVDSFDELERLTRLHQDDGYAPEVLLRITPGIEAHTHEFVMTGQEDSKFGFGLRSGAAGRAIELASASPAVELVGIHMHIGSQVFVADSFHDAVEAMVPFVTAHDLPEFSIGGGLGVPYVEGESAPSMADWGGAIQAAAREAGITARITAEPGRSIAAAAAVTLYTVGTIKDVPGVRTFLSVDGGMSDNPRPVLYASGYETFLPRATDAARAKAVRVVGQRGGSGDLRGREGWVPDAVAIDDVLATPVTGAYGHSMGSNYNKILRPAVVFCRDGDARSVVRRESFDDLVRNDVF